MTKVLEPENTRYNDIMMRAMFVVGNIHKNGKEIWDRCVFFFEYYARATPDVPLRYNYLAGISCIHIRPESGDGRKKRIETCMVLVTLPHSSTSPPSKKGKQDCLLPKKNNRQSK